MGIKLFPSRTKATETPAQKAGRTAEQFAKKFLADQGLKIVAENIGFTVGEIDIIAEQGGELVFVEVRFRSGSSHGCASETVSAPKQQRLIRAAQRWLQQNKQYCEYFCRFDVISIDSVIDRKHTKWDKNAFQVESF